jgi:carbonic anhydrase
VPRPTDRARTKSYPSIELQGIGDDTGERSAKNYAFVDAVARKNVSLTIANIREKSPVLRGLESSGSIKIAGSMYNLEMGIVEFLA